MVRKRPCCVPLCSDKISVRHRFPFKNVDVFDLWIQRINPKLQGLERKKVYDTYLVCDRHFNEQCKNAGSKSLKIYSLPTHLPEFHEKSVKENSFLYPLDITAGIIAKANNDSRSCTVGIEESCDGIQLLGPCSSLSVREDCQVETRAEENISMPEIRVEEMLDGIQPLEPCSSPAVREDVKSTGFSEEPSKEHNVEHTVCKSLLKNVSVTRQKVLTPKARRLYQDAIKLRHNKAILAGRVKNYRTRVKLAEKFATSKMFDYIANRVNDVTYRFFLSQLKSQKVIPKGRRFTLDDKLLALALSKQSNKGYRLLSKYFALPSKRTLTKVLGNFHFDPGVNVHVMEQLKKAVARLTPKDRYCTLVFDELSLQPNIHYDENGDVIVGFQDFGNGERKPVFADHALVFMVRGLKKRWKQPIAFAFIEGSTKTTDLVRCIKDVVTAVQQTGLKVVGTICDQGTSNQAAINYLLKESDEMCKRKGIENRNSGMVINGEEIIPLFDPPHLLKGIRNNLLTKDVLFIWEKGQQVASWRHVLQLYEVDSRHHRDDLRACPKLTEEHVVLAKIKKMKVKNCTQVFSQRLSSTMRLLAEWGDFDGRLEKSAIDTADFLLFMDKLFDSVNGTRIHAVEGKLLRCAVTARSPHVQFWRDAIPVLESIQFTNGKTSTRPPSVKNWVRTVKGFLHIWDKLKEDFKFLAPRNFNQDPLENFFGSVRSHGVRNINPTCSNFKSSFKGLLLNNLVSAHSVCSNCEDDDCIGPLDSLKELVGSVKSSTVCPETPFHVQTPVDYTVPQTRLSRATKVYVTGYLARKVLKKLKGCISCKKVLISDCSVPNNEIIIARSYSAKSLCHPHTTFSDTCNTIVKVITSELPKICYQPGVRQKILAKILNSETRLISCSIHNLHECVADIVVKFYVHQWCNNNNRLLKGKFIPKVFTDPLKKAAYQKYLKSRSGKSVGK
ncbi:uncharacterized protein LOC134533179 isoform X1 [Bacillus rossius redtenbacheri]|uniref:uncharacterized protein LOC134533179 isoform X1 n=1 Tax=Bacillus rossius redtenbacheri TaxID=93214 RepID=UPI002FDD9D9B